MLFSTNIFLYVFLPCVLVCYFVAIGRRQKKIQLGNHVLLLFSILFYAWGSGRYWLILLISVTGNYIFGFLVTKEKYKRFWLVISVVFNLGLLGWFKYGNFFYDNIGFLIYQLTGTQLAPIGEIFLPIGISFFTFQAMSYVIDVYRGNVKVQKNLLNLFLFIALFPQLIAGPIIRYSDIESDLNERISTREDLYYGACRFCFGLAKKVIIADILGKSVDSIFALSFQNLTVPLAWSGVFLYTLQIYFDFSAYSDMAIGMARIFGFHFNENFILPYTSKNITEFWRRWHISLSSFFKDYLYIPLGGNRKGILRTCLNLAIVFLLCGLWHGAAWTFVIWGVYHGAFLVAEKVLKKVGFEMKAFWGQAVTFILVMFGWLIFRSETFSNAWQYFHILFGKTSLEGLQYYKYSYYVDLRVMIISAFAFVVSVVPFKKAKEFLHNTKMEGFIAIFLLLLSMAQMSDATFNPFIYFQF